MEIFPRFWFGARSLWRIWRVNHRLRKLDLCRRFSNLFFRSPWQLATMSHVFHQQSFASSARSLTFFPWASSRDNFSLFCVFCIRKMILSWMPNGVWEGQTQNRLEQRPRAAVIQAGALMFISMWNFCLNVQIFLFAWIWRLRQTMM